MISTFHSYYKNINPVKAFTTAISGLLLLGVTTLVSCNSHKGNTEKAPGSNDSNGILQLPAAKPLSAAEKERLSNECEQWFDTILKNSGFNGGVLVAKGGDIVFEKYRGAVRLGGKDSITPETAFHIASVSKTITGMTTLKLWQDGKINLDDEYSKYFPTFNYPGVMDASLRGSDL